MVLREKVYQVIKQRILQGQYRPGEPLNEKRIIEELHVSRTPFREAINALNEENLVQIFANRGIFVREVTVKDLMDSFEIRYLLEPYVSRLACRYAPREVLRQMESNIKKALTGTYQEMMREDDAFHRTVVKYTDNRQLTKIMTSLYEQNQMQVAMYDQADVERVPDSRRQAVTDSLREHLEIINYMLNNNEEGAVDATQMHLLKAQKRATALPGLEWKG